MRSNHVPIKKDKAAVSRNEGRSNINPNTVTLDLEEPENGKIQGQNTNVDYIQNNQKETSPHTDKESVYNVENRVPPPYVIWVQYMGYVGEDPTIGMVEDLKTRNEFVKYVFLIVLIMLLLTAGICTTIHLVEPLRDLFLQFGMLFAIPAIIGIISLSCALDCSLCTRQAPYNYICLSLAVIFSAIICVFITLRSRTILVYYVLAATIVVVILCVLLACSKFDFTKFMLYIVMVGAALFVIFMLVMIGRLAFGVQLKPAYIVILILMTLLNVIVLAMNLQLILGGRTVELGVGEYAIGAFMVYMSIIDIFIKMLILANLFDSG